MESWMRNGLEPSDISLSEQEVWKKCASLLWDEKRFGELKASLENSFDSLSSLLENTDPSLRAFLEANKVKSLKAFEDIPAKIRKVLKKRFPEKFSEVSKIKNKIQPEGKNQERELSVFAVEKENQAPFVDFILSVCDPTNYFHQWLTYR
jgi:hypothetical protein